MKKILALMIMLVTVAPSWLEAQGVSNGLRFAHPAEEVMSVYTQLSDPHARDTYSTLPASMRQDLWSLHLSRALVELTDLSVEQQAIILQGLGLISRGCVPREGCGFLWQYTCDGHCN